MQDGGNAIEAAVACAATAAVVCPHMNGIGGDNFWLVRPPGQAPVGIDASGAAGRLVEPNLYSEHGLDKIPTRGPLVVNTVAGAVGGWDAALSLARELGGNMPIGRLLEDATPARGCIFLTRPVAGPTPRLSISPPRPDAD